MEQTYNCVYSYGYKIFSCLCGFYLNIIQHEILLLLLYVFMLWVSFVITIVLYCKIYETHKNAVEIYNKLTKRSDKGNTVLKKFREGLHMYITYMRWQYIGVLLIILGICILSILLLIRLFSANITLGIFILVGVDKIIYLVLIFFVFIILVIIYLLAKDINFSNNFTVYSTPAPMRRYGIVSGFLVLMALISGRLWEIGADAIKWFNITRKLNSNLWYSNSGDLGTNPDKQQKTYYEYIFAVMWIIINTLIFILKIIKTIITMPIKLPIYCLLFVIGSIAEIGVINRFIHVCIRKLIRLLDAFFKNIFKLDCDLAILEHVIFFCIIFLFCLWIILFHVYLLWGGYIL